MKPNTLAAACALLALSGSPQGRPRSFDVVVHIPAPGAKRRREKAKAARVARRRNRR